MNINNVINKSDENMRKMYNMFSFIDTKPNTYSSINQYQENLPFLFSSFNDIIQSEDSMSCNITSEDRDDYEMKLQELEGIINSCNNSSNKQECLYNNFNNDEVVNLIDELTNIVLKVDALCLYRKITPLQEENMCSISNNILNGYNVDDLRSSNLFIAKYSSVIKKLKNIADTNIYDYLNRCGADTHKLESYNRAQNILANTLFKLGNVNNTIQNIINNTSIDSTNLNTNIDNTLNATQNTFNSCINEPEVSERITDLNNQIRTLSTNNAILNDKVYKLNDEKLKCDKLKLDKYKDNNNDKDNDNNERWIYIVFMSIFVIIIIVLIYVIMRRRKPDTITYDAMGPYGTMPM